MVGEGFRGGPGTLLGKGQGGGDACPCPLFQRGEAIVVDQALRFQALDLPVDGVARAPVVQFGRGHVGLVVGLEVAALAIGDEFQKSGAAALPDVGDGVGGGFQHRFRVVAVHGFHRQAMARGPVGDGVVGHGLQPVHEGLPLVVFANEQQRQLPLHGQIQGLVEDAFAGGTVAEEDGDDAAGLTLAHFLGQSDAGGHGQLAADDRGGEHHAQLPGRDVQAAAAAATVTVDATQDFRHQTARLGASSDEVTGAAVVGDDAVPPFQGSNHADCAGLLADARAGARCTVLLQFHELVLVGADQQHGFQTGQGRWGCFGCLLHGRFSLRFA